MSEMISSFHVKLAKHRFGNDFFFTLNGGGLTRCLFLYFLVKLDVFKKKIHFLQGKNNRDTYVL